MPARLALRSAYSLLYGVRRADEIAQRAASYGATALGIADRDNLYGVHAFLEAAREAGLKPLVGAELTAPTPRPGSAGRRLPPASPPRTSPAPRPGEAAAGRRGLFAFALDRRGFSRLCELLSGAKLEPSFDLVAALREDSAGLALASTSPALLGALAGRVGRLYAALTPRNLAGLRASRGLGIPLIALDDASFLDPEDYPVHEVLRAIALGKTVGSLAPGDCADREELFLPAPEYERRLSSWPEALRSTEELAAECSFDRTFDGFAFPDYDRSGDEAGGAKIRGPEELLRSRVFEGAEKRYGEVPDGVVERIEYELEIIAKKGFAPYFLAMDDIVAMARGSGGGTCGRGSGAASIVSYALGITNVDPIAHRLYFERFLTMARPDPPDIDVDFAWDERDGLIRRVIEGFGAERCARVANHNAFRPRSALREAAKAYGLPDVEISRAERSLLELGSSPWEERLAGTEGAEPGRPAAADSQKADGRTPALDSPWPEVLAVARRLVGLPRGLSMHCGGLVIAPGPIRRYAPVEPSAEGFPLLGWEKEGTEAAGLVKIDLLGNRSLAVIRDALANLREEGVELDEELWRPEEDEATVAALARGDTMGVFYVESPAMRQLQKKTGRGDFDHIVIHSSIIRPAANGFIAEYVRRLKEEAAGRPRTWKALHPRLERIFDETYGILCYQEDVSKTAVALAGFSEAEADALRRVIAKKAGAAKLRSYEERFFSGCRAKGVDEQTIGAVWAMMLSFDGYSFCKPHSASYAMVSFRSAYLRVHFPAVFMAAVLSNQGGYYRPQAYVSEARRMGLEVVGPDVNRSRWRYYGRGKAVVVGLMAVAELSRSAAEGLVAEREKRGPFASLAELSSRVRLGRDDILALVAAGALDALSPGLRRADQARILLGARLRSGESAVQAELFAASREEHPRAAASGSAYAPTVPGPISERKAAAESELREEYASLGFLREHHPFALWRRELARIDRVLARDLGRYRNRRVKLLGWPVTQKEVLTSDGRGMDFVSFEDETALYETVLFPEAFEGSRKLLFDQLPLVVSGKVKDDQGALIVEVEDLEPAVRVPGRS